MEYAIYYDEKYRSLSMRQLSGITDPTNIVRTFHANKYIEALRLSYEITSKAKDEEKILVMIIDYLEEPVFTAIYNKLDEFKRIVSGTIDITNCYDLSDYDIICNDEGKIMNLPLSRALLRDNEIYDIIAGKMIITKSNDEGETIGLSLEDADKVHEFFYYPELFSFSNNNQNLSVVKSSIEMARIMKQNFISNISLMK